MTTPKVNPPVILLAFANDQIDSKAHLRNLARELNEIKQSLDHAEDEGLCQLQLLPNADLDQLIHVFQRKRFRNQIAIFHYGGHANTDELLLSTPESGLSGAKAKGLIPFLAEQKGLKLVFLNGCFSIQQAQALIDAGIPAVIGTIAAVSDHVATELSSSFYRALAEGATLEQAWKEATFHVQAQQSDDEITFLYRDDRGIGVKKHGVRFPWEIQFRPGYENIRNWNLPDAARSPYFGLPEIPPHYDFPDEPFRFLSRYTKAEARVFFGRGAYIRDLYHRLQSPHAAPIILLSGQSGVGKSSLLEAGLFPRLETAFTIVHLRYDPQLDLWELIKNVIETPAGQKVDNTPSSNFMMILHYLRGMRDQLSETESQHIDRVIMQLSDGSGESSSAILQKPRVVGRRLIVIDQLEEVYTRSIAAPEQILTPFLKKLRDVISRPELASTKFIFSYRKEFDQEIEQALRLNHLVYEKVFLRKLDEEGIEEVVNGLTNSTVLSNRYRLQVEEGLAPLLAKNLLADKNSPISPVLQIILTKMWREQKVNDLRLFQVESYQALRKNGILLEDFFQEQMLKVKAWETQIGLQVESSGLALDILHYHTTEYQTAGARDLHELRTQYGHAKDILDGLISKFEQLYLLSRSDSNRTILAHDTLGPIITTEVYSSGRPGQRAVRILNSKMIDYLQNPQKTIIDEEDLALVEKGAGGMRMWTIKEQELIDKSKRRRAQLQAERKRRKNIGIAGIVIISFLLIIATLLWQASIKEAKVNRLVSLAFQIEDEDATQSLALLEEALSILPNHHIAIQARHDIYLNNEFYFQTISNRNEIPLNWAVLGPGDSILISGQERNIKWWGASGTPIDSLALGVKMNSASFSKEGQFLCIGGEDGQLRLIFSADQELMLRKPHAYPITALAVSPNGQLILSGDLNGSLNLWDRSRDSSMLPKHDHSSEITALSFSSSGEFFVSGDAVGQLMLHDSKGTRLWTRQQRAKITSVHFGPAGKTIFVGLRNGTLVKWSKSGQFMGYFSGHQKRINSLSFSPDGSSFLSASDDRNIILWDTSMTQLRTYRGHHDIVSTVQFSGDGQFFVSAANDGSAKWWKVKSKVARESFTFPGSIRSLDISEDLDQVLIGLDAPAVQDANQLNALDIDFFDQFEENERSAFVLDLDWQQQQELIGHLKPVSTAKVNPVDGGFITGDDDGKIIIWNAAGERSKTLDAHNGSILAISFSPQGHYLASASADETAILWTSDGDSLLTLEHPQAVSDIDFLANEQAILTTSYDGNIRKWSLEGDLLQTWSTGSAGPITVMTLSPDRKRIVTGHGGVSDSLKLWNLNGQLLYATAISIENSTGAKGVRAVAFTPNGEKIIAGGEGGLLKVFTHLGKPIQTNDDCNGSSIHALHAPDNNKVIIATSDGRLRLFPLLR
ncbi:MAG: CHAT domain-containing protein [Saprospiraceae bacterium]|nr:CHAT domain-containing protein [Saprospiraceae bacterium]